MKLHLNLSLRRALMAAMAAVCTLSSTSFAGVVDGRYDLQYYLDFCRNKGMFATGATNIEVFFKDGTSVTNNTIPLMPNMVSYGQTVSSIIGNKIGTNGGTNLVSSQFVYGAKHVHAKVGNSDVAFLAENGLAVCVYDSANLDNFGTDSAIQRLTKLVTSVAYTPMADDDFMRSLSLNSSWIYRLGNGGPWSDGKSISTGDNSLGGVVNLSVKWQDANTGEWYLEGWARKNDQPGDTLTPLEIGTYFGDSGSPIFAWDDANDRFVFAGAQWAGGCQLNLPNWYLLRYNYQQGTAMMDKYTVAASFSGTDTILWSASDATSGKGTLTQGADTVVDYTGKGTGNSLGDSLGLTFSTDDTATTRELQLQGNVNMGAGALTFENGKWRITETDGNDFSLSSAGFDISEGAEVTWELTGVSGQEIRKVGEGILTIAGSGDNAASLVVGGGTTVYNVVRDENGNITGCTLGNAGETRLNRTDGFAASSVRLEGGVAIVVLMADNQFKTNSVAGDTFSFGNDGGLLNLNGHDLSWGVINQNGSGTGARIGNVTPSGEDTPGLATFTYTGTSGTFAGSFMDEGADGAQLAVKYNSEGGTWKLTGQSNNAGGYTVQAGTMVLEGTRTPHVLTTDWSDWTYAGIETSEVAVKSGATFQLSHHALLKGDVTVESGGAFILNQTVNAASESISGSLRKDMASLGITSLVGNVTLNGTASMTVNTNSPVTTTMKGNVISDAQITGAPTASFTKTGNGVFVVEGQMGYVIGNVEAGGLVITDSSKFGGYFPNWTIGEQGFLAVQGMSGGTLAGYLNSSSSGVLALTSNQLDAIDLTYTDKLYIGAYGETPIEYGTSDVALSANSEGNWLLGGGTGTLNVNFLLTGNNNLIIGNEHSSGTVHLTNTSNNFTGDIYIKGTGNFLTYVNGALGSARVALTYGNTLGLNDVSQLDILKEGSAGILALTESMSLDLTGKSLSIGAAGEVTLTDSVTVNDDTYRFGGKGDLTLDTELSSAGKMELDGQGNSGSSVTFARENAYTGDITAGGGLYLESANSAGDIAIHVGHESALAAASSVNLQKGAILYTDGNSIVVNNLSAQSGSGIQNNGETASLLQLNVDAGKETLIANGVLNSSSNTAALGLVKTGAGTLEMGGNTSWSGGLTIMEGTVKGSIAAGGIGAAGAAIYVDNGATLQLTSGASSNCKDLAGTLLQQKLSGTGVVSISNGNDMLFLNQSAGFAGQVKVTGNTRLYITQAAQIDSSNSFSTSQAFDKTTIVVESGSQARVSPSIFSLSTTVVNSWANYVISGSSFNGASSGLVQSQDDGALLVDCLATVWGNVTLADDAMISSWSHNPTTSRNFYGSYPYYCGPASTSDYGNRYGIINRLGGIIRGQILGTVEADGTVSDLTIGGNEGMTITADSANTFGDLYIANGNGHNIDEAKIFALQLDGGAARSQVSTALGTGNVTLNEGLILRFGGTGTANMSDVVYTYENDISAGAGATLQSYNITNKLTGTVSMSGDSLSLKTANGGVLELAGGINGSGTLNVGADSKVILGSAATTMALTRSTTPQFSGTVAAEAGADITLASPSVVSTNTAFTGTDSLTLHFGGTDDYTLGGITMNASSEDVTSVLTLNFDFTGIPSENNSDTWTTLSSSVTAGKVLVALDLNMFNDIASGSYTLVDGTLAATEYAMADDLNGRLTLETSPGKLVLVVGGDNRLYWRTDGASQEWNTADANWYLEGVTEKTAFTAGKDVVFDATGVTADNSATARETVNLPNALTVGTMAVKDAYYEIGGDGALTGEKLAVGEQGDLKLNTTSASFTNGVQVDNASLEVSGTTLTANVSAANGGSFAMNDGASLAGNIEVNGGTAAIADATVSGNINLGNTSADASIVNSSVTGTISTQGSGSATLDTLTLTGEITTEDGGCVMAASAYDGATATYAAAKLSGELNWGGESGHSLSLTSGSLYLDGKVNLAELSVGAGLAATVWNATATSGSEKNLGTVKLGEGATFNIYDVSVAETDTTIDCVELSGSNAIVQDTYNASRIHINTLNLANGVDSAMLKLYKNSGTAASTVFELGSADATPGNFSGTIELKATNGTYRRSVFLVLSNGEIAQKAEVSLAGVNGSTDAYIGLGINAENVTIAGLDSLSTIGNRAKVFSGTIEANVSWNTSTSAPATIGDALRTLTIDTASGSAHEFYGEIMSNLNLVKTGVGTQKLLGTSGNFNGSLSIEGGTLALGSSSAVGTLAGLSVSNGATLDLSAVSIDTSFAGLSLAAGATGSFGSGALFALGALEAETSYHIFDLSSGATLEGWNSNNLDVDNFTINGEALRDLGHADVALDSESGSFTYYVNNYDLVWNGGASGIWNREECNTAWLQSLGGTTSETSIYFANNDNVSFLSDAVVTLSEDVKVGSMTIGKGATVELTAQNGAAITTQNPVKLHGTLIMDSYALGTIQVEAGQEGTLQADTAVISSLEMTKTSVLNLKGGTYTAAGDIGSADSAGTVNFYGSNLDLSGKNLNLYGEFKVLGSTMLTANRTGDDYTTGVHVYGDLIVGENATLSMDGSGRTTVESDGRVILQNGAQWKRSVAGGYWIAGSVQVAEKATATLNTSDSIWMRAGGSIDVLTEATLNLTAGAGINSQDGQHDYDINVGVNAVLNLQNTTLTMNGESSLSLAQGATFNASAGTVNLNGAAISLASASRVQGTLNASGTVGISVGGDAAIDSLSVTGGTTTVSGAGKLSVTTATFSGGTTNFNGSTSLTTANFSGGTVNFATDSLEIGSFNRGSGNINFKLAEGATKTSYTIGGISGSGSGTLSVADGVTVQADSLVHNAVGGGGNLAVDGVLTVKGNLNLSYGWGESISGAGKINVEGNATFTTWGGTNINVAALNVDGNLALGSYGMDHNLNLSGGTLTVGGAVSISQNQGATNLNIKGGSLIMKGGATMNQGTTTLSAGKLEQAGGTSTISNTFCMSGGELVVSGGSMTISATPTVTGGDVAISGGTLSFGSAEAASALLSGADNINLSGGELDLSVGNFTESSGGLSLGAVMAVSGSGIIKLGDNLTTDTTYDIFTIGDGASLDWANMGDHLMVNGSAVSRYSGASLAVTEAGVATLSFSSLDKSSVYWVGGESGAWDYSSSSWDLGTADADASNNVSFLTNDTVVFASDAAVTVADGVTVGGLTIEAGKHLTTTGGIELADSASITTGADSRWTLAAGTEQTLSKTQVSAVTALEIAKGATLTVSDSAMAGYSATNLSGEGTVKLYLSGGTVWSNDVKLGSNFTGTTYVASGNMDLSDAEVGSTLRLADGVNANSADGAVELTANLILEGTSIVHANSSKAITYKGTVTGENGVFESNGASSHTFNAEVNLAGFKTSHSSNTNTFDAKTTLGTATISQAKVNFNGETTITTANISGGTTNFSGETSITSANISNGTTNFNGTATLTSLTHTGGDIHIKGGNTEMKGRVNSTGGNFRAEGGEVKLSYTGEDGNKILTLDGSMSGSARGTVRLAKDVKVSTTNLYGTNGSSVILESGAELTHQSKITMSNKGETEASLKSSGTAQVYSAGNATFALSNGHMAVSSNDATEVKNLLTNSSVENAGSGKLTVSNSGNSITDVYATSGSIDIEQLNAAVNLNLSELTVADSKTVGLYSGSGDSRVEANVTVTSRAEFGSGAVLNANLTLQSGSTLGVAEGGLAMGSTLTLQKGLTLDDTTLGRVHALSAGESTALFTGVDGLTLDKTSYTSLTESDSMLANPYFTNLNSSNQYVLTYSGTDNGTLSIMAASVPEPTTTTLSLLALSALAMRRRRK